MFYDFKVRIFLFRFIISCIFFLKNSDNPNNYKLRASNSIFHNILQRFYQIIMFEHEILIEQTFGIHELSIG